MNQIARLSMDKGEVCAFQRNRKYTIQAETGSLWITQSNKPQDIFLEAGETFVVDESGKVVAEAMSSATMLIDNKRIA